MVALGVSNATRGSLSAFLTCILWGSESVVLALTLSHFPPTFTAAVRFIMGAVAFGCAAAQRGEWASMRGRLFPGLALLGGAALAGQYLLFISGIGAVGATQAGVLLQLGPFLFMLLSIGLFHEHLSLRQWIGVATALLGFGAFYIDRARAAETEGLSVSAGHAFIFGACISWAVFACLHKDLTRRYPAHTVNFFVSLSAALILLPIALLEISAFSALAWSSVWRLFLAGGVTTASYFALTYALQNIRAAFVTMIVVLNPVVTVVLVYMLHACGAGFVQPEHLGYLGIAGITGILGGAMLVIR